MSPLGANIDVFFGLDFESFQLQEAMKMMSLCMLSWLFWASLGDSGLVGNLDVVVEICWAQYFPVSLVFLGFAWCRFFCHCVLFSEFEFWVPFKWDDVLEMNVCT